MNELERPMSCRSETPTRSSMFVPRRKLVLADSQPLQHSDCPWDDELDSRQPRFQRQARAFPKQAACLDQPSDLPAAQQQLTPPAVASSFYGQAQAPLGTKEKALYKMSDLKQVRPREENAAHNTDLSCTEGSSQSPASIILSAGARCTWPQHRQQDKAGMSLVHSTPA